MRPCPVSPLGREGAYVLPTPTTAAIWFDPSDSSTVFSDIAGTVPAIPGDPVGRITNKGTSGGYAAASTNAERPTLVASGGLTYLDASPNVSAMYFSSGISGVFTGTPFMIVAGAKSYLGPSPSGGTTIIGGQGTSLYDNLHIGILYNVGYRMYLNLFSDNYESSTGSFDNQSAVQTYIQKNSGGGRTFRYNRVQISSGGSSNTLNNSGLQLFKGPVTAASGATLRLYGLIGRISSGDPSTTVTDDELYMSFKAGVAI